MCQKDLGKREPMKISQARIEHQTILARLMQGPSDGEAAMRRAETAHGLGYWSQWNLRHKRRATDRFMWLVHQAFLTVLETSATRDLAYLENQALKEIAHAGSESLLAEAENLLAQAKATLAQIQKRRAL